MRIEGELKVRVSEADIHGLLMEADIHGLLMELVGKLLRDSGIDPSKFDIEPCYIAIMEQTVWVRPRRDIGGGIVAE